MSQLLENGKTYTSYGVLSYSNNLNHSRLTNWKYFAFISIIKDDIELNAPIIEKHDLVSVYPNPSSTGNFSIRFENIGNNTELFLTDATGRCIRKWKQNGSKFIPLNIQEKSGIYFLIIKSKDRIVTKKLIKL